MAGMKMDYNVKNLGLKNFSSCFHASNGRGLFSLCKLRLYLPLDVQR